MKPSTAPIVPFSNTISGTVNETDIETVSANRSSTPPYATANDLPAGCRMELIALMNRRLATAVDLETQLKQAHWNVKGPNFIAPHGLFDEIHGAVSDHVDLIAERIAQLGGIAAGTARVAAAHSQIGEYPLDCADGAAHVEAVVRALSGFGRAVRLTIDEAGAIEDAGTADLFTEISRGIDKWLWMVEAHRLSLR